MTRHLFIAILSLVALAACQQDQTTLKFGPATVFEDRFSDNVFGLEHDDGSDVELRSVRPSAARGLRGSHGNDENIFNFAGCGIFGCNNNPWSYWAGYSNYAHSWNPNISRNVVVQFRQQQIFTTQAQFAPQGQEGCWNVTLESSHRIRAMRGRSAHPMQPLRVQGNYSKRIQVQVGSLPQLAGTLAFALEEDPYSNCEVPEWYNYGVNHFVWPGCGGQRTRATLRMTGTVSQCGAGGPASTVAAHSIDLDLTPYINSDLGGYYYQMPYFALPASQDRQFFVTGRVLDYGNGHHFWGASN